MISKLNLIINRFFKFLLFINLVLILLVWTLIYPYLRWRFKKHKRRTWHFGDYLEKDFTKYPSYSLLVMYNRARGFWNKFIF
jgi:hypothetical protein